MSLVSQIDQQLKEAMKSRNAALLITLRALKSVIQNYMIDHQGQEISDEIIVKLIKTEVKKRKDAIELYNKGGRDDLAQIELSEIQQLKVFLPEEMSEANIQKSIDEVVEAMGDISAQDFGKVMGQVMAKVGENADGTIVSRLLKQKLSS